MKIARTPHLTLEEIKEEIKTISTYAQQHLWVPRLEAEANRMAFWPGQSSDGLKHEEAIGAEPEPFEGATDTRMRLADQLVNEEVMLLVVSALRAQIRVSAVEGTDLKRANRQQLTLQWLLRNHLGVRWMRELVRLANYYAADCPAIAMMRVWWEREWALGLEKVDAARLLKMFEEQIGEAAAENGEQDPSAMLAAAQPDLEAMVGMCGSGRTAPEDVAFLAAVMGRLFPSVSEKMAKSAARDLCVTGKADFPVPYLRKNGPQISARRFMEDFWLHVNSRTFESAPLWFEAEWLSAIELRGRIESGGYSESFVEKVLGTREAGSKGTTGGFEGVPAFVEYVKTDNGMLVQRDHKYYLGLYHIVTAYYQASDENGIPGLWVLPLHQEVDEAAHKPRLVDDQSGEWPAIVLQREVLGGRLLDSRGIPETAGPFQGLMKMFTDSYGDHAQIAGVPPIITRGRQKMGQLRIRPLEELQAKRDGDYKWLQPPAYPATVANMITELRLQVNEYYGRSAGDVAPDLVQLQKMFKVSWWLIQVREIVKRLMQLAQAEMPEEMFERITNSKGDQVVRTREEIQGQFDLTLVFDPADLNPENLQMTATIVKDLLMAMDRDKIIQAAPVVSSLFYRLAPELADAALQDVDAANNGEIEDEVKAYQQIRAGIEPDLADDGSVNYQLRMQLYQNMEQMNPEIYKDLPEDKMAILQSRLERMQVLAQQYGENVEIGRQGGRKALGE